MKEVLRTNNVIAMQMIREILAEADIETLVLDQHAGGLFGGVGGMGPRLMVLDDDQWEEAVTLIEQSGIGI